MKSEGRRPAVPGSPSMVEDRGSCGYTNGEPTTGPAPPRAQEQPLGEGALERNETWDEMSEHRKDQCVTLDHSWGARPE